MPENRGCGRKDLSLMSTEELEQILRQDVEAPADQEADTDFLLDIMEVLADRNKDRQTEKTAEEAWESFQEHYAPKSWSCRSAKPVRPWIRRLIAAAAALVLILCIPVTARALDWNELWNVVARWAKETFSFVSGDAEQVSEPEATDAIEYTSLQDLLKRNNRPYDMIPTWIPDGFSLKDIEKLVTPEQEIYKAVYSNKDREFTLRVQTFFSGKIQNSEIEENASEVYVHSDHSFYFSSNMGQLQVFWIDGSLEYIISGYLSYDEAKEMINSIMRG